MKILMLLIAVAGFAVGSPSETGMINGHRLGWEKREIYNVPDAGGTLTLLALGLAGLALYRRRVA